MKMTKEKRKKYLPPSVLTTALLPEFKSRVEEENVYPKQLDNL